MANNDYVTTLQSLLTEGLSRIEGQIPPELMMAALTEHSDLIRSNLVYVVQEGLKFVTGFSIDRMKIDRLRTPPEVIGTLPFIQEIEADVLLQMPGQKAADATPLITTTAPPNEDLAKTVIRPKIDGDGFHFSYINKEMTDKEVAERLTSLGLRPVDAYELCAINAEHLDFAHKYPNGTIWQMDGEWCLAACYSYLNTTRIAIKRHTNSWRAGYWIVGTPIMEAI